MRAVVVYGASPHAADESAVELPDGATLFDAIRASGLLVRHPSIDLDRHRVGVWGRVRPLQQALRDGDRVEVYRALTVDPMEARRLRAAAAKPSGSRRR